MTTHIARPFPALDRTGAPGGSAALLARGSAGVYLIKVLGAGLLFAVQVLFARVLGVESFGIYSLAVAWLSILLLVGRQGFDAAAVRYVAAYRGRREWGLLGGFMRFSRRAVLAMSAATAFLFAAGAWLLSSRFGTESLHALWVAAATIPVFALAQLYEAVLRGLKYLVSGSVVLVVAHPAILIVAFALATDLTGGRYGAGTAMAAYLAASAVALAALWLMCRRRLPAEARDRRPEFRAREWFGAAASMMLVMGFGPILNQLGVIIVGALDGAASAGIYGAGIRVANLIQIQIIAVTAAFSPLAADLHARGERAELQRVTTFCVRVAFLAAVAAAAVIAGLGRWILGFLGPEFAAAHSVLAVLAFGQVVLGAAAPAGILLNMTGHHVAAARIFALGAALTVALSLGLVPVLGALGGAVASLASTAATMALMAVTAARRLGIVAAVVPWVAAGGAKQPPVNLKENSRV